MRKNVFLDKFVINKMSTCNLILTLVLLLMSLSSCEKAPIAKETIIQQFKDFAGKPLFIRIFKEEHELEMWVEENNRYQLLKSYKICTWSGSLGPKLKEGDGQSPEGFYSFGQKHLKPDSKYHRAFNIGYPNEFDIANGRTGSFIMVHGDCVSIGCYAMTDPIIEEIYYLVEQALLKGQDKISIHIFPFRMSDEKLKKFKDNKNYPFWQNLKEGYDLFELNKVPPKVLVEDKKYKFK